jgi:hypothetical protein
MHLLGITFASCTRQRVRKECETFSCKKCDYHLKLHHLTQLPEPMTSLLCSDVKKVDISHSVKWFVGVFDFIFTNFTI